MHNIVPTHDMSGIKVSQEHCDNNTSFRAKG